MRTTIATIHTLTTSVFVALLLRGHGHRYHCTQEPCTCTLDISGKMICRPSAPAFSTHRQASHVLIEKMKELDLYVVWKNFSRAIISFCSLRDSLSVTSVGFSSRGWSCSCGNRQLQFNSKITTTKNKQRNKKHKNSHNNNIEHYKMMKSITYNEGEGGELELEDVEVGKNQSVNMKASRAKNIKSYILGIALVLAIVFIIVLGVYLIHDSGNESDAAPGHRRMNTSPLPLAPARKQHSYMSSPTDPIPTSLRLIDDPLIIRGYPSGEEGCQALTDDIYNASAILANEIIKSNVEQGGDDGAYPKGTGRSYSYSSHEKIKVVSESSYETNNQEAGVDEADIMKSDGKHVFTAYGDMLVVWDVNSGKQVSLTKMPKRSVLSWPDGGYCDHERMASISGLLLDTASKRLVVIASGYESEYRDSYDGPKPVLGGKGDTRVFLYDVSSLPEDGSELTLLATLKMDGVYKSARMIDGVAHVVRTSTINQHEHISSRLSRSRAEYKSDTKEIYIAHAKSNAEQWLLPGFAKQLTEELRDSNGSGDCSAVTRLALYVSGDGLGDDYPSSVISNGNIIQSYIQVSSFAISTPKNRGGDVTMNPSLSSSLFPSTNLELYSSKDVLVVSGSGYHHYASRRRSTFSSSTYFLSFRLHDDASAPTGLAIGRAPGHLLNQFAMDEYQGYFRVATTEQPEWGCIKSRSNSQCQWEMVAESKSRLSVFKFPEKDSTSGEMELVKVLDNLGVREEIKSVRFFDSKSFLVTFRLSDPLYTIDFSNPEDPEITNELNISGYSSYLHPVSPDRLLAIGKEANETTGEVSGFQITLFDVSNLQDTRVLQRHTIDEKWASSSAESDHLAFRYLNQSQLLIIPISIEYDFFGAERDKIEPFDGFQVFSVTDDNIEPRFNISMTTPSEMRSGCWYGAYLPARSMVIEGNVTVAKGHAYASYDLNTEQMRWRHNLDLNLRGEQCLSYW